MRTVARRLLTALWLLTGLALAVTAGPAPRPTVVALNIDSVIGPATADFVARGLARARSANAGLVVLEMDTPGGLDASMRRIIHDILASPVPVATYVSPSGARAASAGTYILYASHIAAMAPATNLGAATPVAIGMPDDGGPAPDARDGKEPQAAGKQGDRGDAEPARKSRRGGTMMQKVENDAAAYLRSLAQLRGRNPDFAERAVREAASLSADEALAAKVIDLVASDLPDLLKRLDGREVRLDSGNTVRLATAGATPERIAPDWRNRLLALLSNPQLALVLMMIGIYGLFFEFTSPGFGVPGVAGLICLLVALYAFQLLPVNWAGVALIAIGAMLMLAEAFLPSFGALGVGGIVAFVVGGLFLMDTEAPDFGIPLPLVVGLALASAAVILAIGGLAARSRKRPAVSGREALVGATGVVTIVGAGGARAQVQGESWAVSAAVPLATGAPVRVVAVRGLTLEVEPVAATPSAVSDRSPG